ncbi:rhomboid family intramembrane serine protease [Paracoccus sp. Z118]|uniref:rhomboid family intramembrane serine protease n=1 Tax=Paracoccus sp. Z118 TaxID=2851017 RepID=UPI001C2C9779|nr:rhomboid family intramembrane serine protease [Paracoccus sp. Z118]MBV0891060.1 rhomboid family intramembrane serine protease [Paracoccus sp. Z118]
MPMPFRVIIGLCVAVEAALTLAGLLGFPALRQVAFLYGGFFAQLLDSWHGLFPGQPITMFVTYGFLHAGLLHLGMNMLALAQLAQELARVMSGRAMLLVYGVSQIAAALAQAWLAPGGAVMVGASGAVFGLAGALIAYGFVALRRRNQPMGPLIRSAAVLVALNVALALMVPQIAWQAHLGGAVAGALMGLAYAARGPRRRRR